MDRKTHVDRGMQDIFRPRLAGECTPRGTMIGMDMGIDDEADSHPGLVRDTEVSFNVAQRVHHRTGGVPATAKEVRDRHGIGMEELTQNHGSPPVSGGSALTRIAYSIILLIDPYMVLDVKPRS